MIKTRLISIALILMLSAPLVIAQSTNKGKTSFAILGGVNFQNIDGKDYGDKLKNNLLIGFHAGFNIQIPIAPEFFLQPGLLYSVKGAKSTTGTITNTFKLSYIELPLNVVYKALLGKGYIMVGFGPYVAYGIGTEGSSKDVEFNDVVETNTVTYFKPLDAGANIFVGYELVSGIFCQLNTQLGMLKINPVEVPDYKLSAKNTGFGLSIGYRF